MSNLPSMKYLSAVDNVVNVNSIDNICDYIDSTIFNVDNIVGDYADAFKEEHKQCFILYSIIKKLREEI